MKQEYENPVDGVEYDPGKRWEEGRPHHPKSEALMRRIVEVDFHCNDDHFCWKVGGDGDNGEILMYDLDIIFDEDDARGENVEKERDALRQWVSDLQSGMYINCVYCGHRYGPREGTPASMADVLKAHIEVCPEHPLSKSKKENIELRARVEELKAVLREFDRCPYSCDGCGGASKSCNIGRVREALKEDTE